MVHGGSFFVHEFARQVFLNTSGVGVKTRWHPLIRRGLLYRRQLYHVNRRIGSWRRSRCANDPAISTARILTPSQGAQVIGHVAEFLDHPGVAEIARSRIASAAERDRADVALFARCRSDLAMRRSCSG